MPWLLQEMLTEGVMWRRVLGWCVDVLLLAILLAVLAALLLPFGLLTFGLGFSFYAVLPIIPFLYHTLFLIGRISATPGQRMLGLVVRNNDDLGPPSPLQAVISTLLFYLTLATSGLLLLVALFTLRHRTLHDLLSGLVVVRVRGMQALTQPPGYWNMPGGPR